MAEGSQTFEEALAALIVAGTIDRKEGLAHADSPTNLMWRLQNDFSGSKPVPAPSPDAKAKPAAPAEDEQASFTDIVLDIGSHG